MQAVGRTRRSRWLASCKTLAMRPIACKKPQKTLNEARDAAPDAFRRGARQPAAGRRSMPLGGAKAAAAAAEPIVVYQSSGFHLVSFLLGILAALAAVACYAIQTDADPYMFDAPLGECVRDSAHRKKKACCLLYTSPSPRDATLSRMPSSA